LPLTATNTPPAGDDSMHMPLESLITRLKQNGFSIRPDDYIEILKVIERFQPATLQEAGNLICPLIVSSEEDQVRFGVVFRKICEDEEESIGDTKAQLWWKNLKDFIRQKKRYIIGVGIGLLITGVLLIILTNKRASSHTLRPVIAVERSTSQFYVDNAYRQGDTLAFNSKLSFPVASDSSRVDWEWDLGQGWGQKNEQYVYKVLEQRGEQTTKLRFLSKNDNSPIADTAVSYFVCEKMPRLNTFGAGMPIIFERFDTLQIELPDKDMGKYETAWLVGDDTVARNTLNLNYVLDSTGNYNFYFVMYPHDGDPRCTYKTEGYLNVWGPKEKVYQFTTVPGGDAIKKPFRIKNGVMNFILCTLIITGITGFILGWIDKKRKKRAKATLDAATSSTTPETTAKKPPYEIPMENRQYQLVASEQAMNDVLRFMHQRTRDEALALNIPQTVQNTIRTGGVPDLVYSNRLRPNDYLILIDSRVSNSQQLKLFEYLVGTFRNENMSIVNFYYKDDFSTFYNKQFPAGLTLKRLTELYKEYTLIIYGTAYHLIYQAYPTINADRFNELADWENKAILTPVPYQDWSIKEKLIGQQMILLPADAEGQLRLIKAINEKMLRHNDYLSSAENFYSTTLFDFTDTADIKEYLADEDLFQCICGIAVYPGVRWEVLIEISKAVLETRDCLEKLNYTNLLKFVRISWLHEGYFPEQTRLDLLKQLGVKEEIAARQQLIELLTYADTYFNDNYYFSDEKKMQETTNKFVVYAHDPASHAQYLPAKEQFEALWRNNKITDAPLKKYIDNAGKKWETPLQQNDKTITASDYFNDKGTLNPPPPALRKWSDALKAVASICFVLFIGMFFWGNDLAETKAADFLRINTVDSMRTIPITIKFNQYGYCITTKSDSTIFKSLQLTLSSRSKQIAPTDSIRIEYNNVPTGDYNYTFDIRYADLAYPISLEALWSIRPQRGVTTPKNESGRVYGTMGLTTNSLMLGITGCEYHIYPPIEIRHGYSARALEQAKALEQNLSTSGFRNVVSATGATADSVIVWYYDVANETEARSLADIVSRYINYQVGIELITDSAYKGYTILLPELNASPVATCITMPIEKLPGNLTEIWKGQRSNRFITIHLSRKRIYYSTGDKKSYGTYTIEEVCQRGNQYKIITSANSQYKNFYLRNVGNEQFELSACQGFLPSLRAAQADSSDCNNYDVMKLYYESDPPADLVNLFKPRKLWAFYLPYSGQRLYASESYRLNTYLSMAKDKGIGKLDLNGVLNSALPTSRSSAQYFNDFANYFQTYLGNFGMQMGKQDYDGSDGTPFDRNYFWFYELDNSDNPATVFNVNAISKSCGRIQGDHLRILSTDSCGLRNSKEYAAEVSTTLPPGDYTAAWELSLDSIDAGRYRNIMLELFVLYAGNNEVITFGNTFSNAKPSVKNFGFHTLDFTIPATRQNDNRIKLALQHSGYSNINLRRVTITKR
jgi:hypothetical protein